MPSHRAVATAGSLQDLDLNNALNNLQVAP